MTRRASLGSGLGLVAAVATLTAALAGPARPADRSSKPAERWSGYVVTGNEVSFSSASGTWVEPSVRCRKGGAPALSTVWVGIGGYANGSNVLDQVGTDANCSRSGQASYFAWFELLPDIAHDIVGKVEAGDTMIGSVTIAGVNLIDVKLENATRRWTFDRKIQAGSPDRTSAEWIVEAPYSCVRFTCHQAPLANFGSVSIRSIAATGNGERGTLKHAAWRATPLVLAPCVQTIADVKTNGLPAVAVPREISRDGSSFAIAWGHETGKPELCSGNATGAVGVLPDYTLG